MLAHSVYLNIIPSKKMLKLLIMLYLLVVSSILVSALSFFIKLSFIVFLILHSLYVYHFIYINKKHPLNNAYIFNNLKIQTTMGWGEVFSYSFVHPYCIIIHSHINYKKQKPLVLFNDSITAEAHRHLRTFIRHPHKTKEN